VGLAFVAAQVGLGIAIWRYKARGTHGERAVYSHGNNRLEIVWTAITAFIFIGLGLMGQRVWASLHLHEAPPGATRVHVVAQQFQWNFHYPGRDNAFGRTDPKFVKDADLNFVGLDDQDPNAKDDQVVTTLALPVGREVELTLQSKDVTHDLFVPELRYKQDVVPGMSIPMSFKLTHEGRFELACAELCGQLHYKMKSYLLALPPDVYDSLVALPQAEFQGRITQLIKEYPLGIKK
ncbi:MAG TPA: cytochrome c oxidase subunit II, partial [Pyrinomonadaceae bacterium]|nr:cytochrome c oxidase subunit II [Pyrinomonadaceae bacterium]